jgi:hypothetical protein
MVSHFLYSGQHFYQQSAHAEHMIHTSNRLRSESGSSESSRGSGSTGSGKNRRRSHRPRGCRGGSNRRRNNVSEGKKKALQHTSQADFSGDAIRGNNFSYNNANVPSRYDGSFIPHNTQSQYQLQGMYSGYSNASADTGYSRYSDFIPSSGLNNSSYHMNNEYFGLRGGNSFGTTDFPSLQTSFSDSSNEMIPGYDDNRILPPMPTNAFLDQRPIPTGPNPYALNTSTSGKSMFNPARLCPDSVRATLPSAATSVSLSVGAETRSHAPGILEPLQHVLSNSRQNTNVGEMVMGPGTDFSCIRVDKSAGMNADQDNIYRAKRLEKQRQNVEGGTLFVTSPRSFLMGAKSSFHEPLATTSAPVLQSY